VPVTPKADGKRHLTKAKPCQRRLLYVALQLFCILDKFVSAWMLTKISVAEREGTTAKSSLFWCKAINQIKHPR